MRIRMSVKPFLLACAAAFALAPAQAQQSSEPAEAPAPPHIDIRPGYAKLAELPDWSGVWRPDWAALFGRGGFQPPELTPQAAKTTADFKAAQAKGENLQGEAANCVPSGMPGIMRQPYPLEFVFSPGTVYILAETYSQVRRIYTDGRPLPEDPDPYFNGHSVGHWEGDALVVDTIGLNPKLMMMPESLPGIRVTENTKIHERIQKESPDRLVVEFTITDPSIFTKPYTFKQPYILKPGWEIREYVCQENNRDSADPFGRPSMNIDF